MSTLFERFKEQMDKLINSMEEVKYSIQENTSTLSRMKNDINSALLNFSDIIGEKVEELEEKLQGAEQSLSPNLEPIMTEFENLTKNMKKTMDQMRYVMQFTTKSIQQIASFAKQPPIVSKPVSTTPFLPQKAKFASGDLLPPSRRAPVPFKIGQTVLIEVFNLLDSIKTRIDYPAIEFAKILEQIRDEIVRIYKFHPALYELGTFARKLKKYPQNMKIDPDIISLLFDKVEEWKRRMGGVQ